MPSSTATFAVRVDLAAFAALDEARFLLRGLWMGDRTRYGFNMIKGLGDAVRSSDTPRVAWPGDISGSDYDDARNLTVELTVLRDSVAVEGWRGWLEAQPRLTALRAAWKAAQADEVMLMYLPGQPEYPMTLFGRPRGVDDKINQTGAVECSCTFRMLDPYLYGAEVATSNVVTTAMTNRGTAETERFTVRIVGSGSTPILTNESDSSNVVGWLNNLGAAAVRVLDFKTRTVVDGSGNDKTAEVDPASPWFVLQPGPNSITVTGVTSASGTHRPAWE